MTWFQKCPSSDNFLLSSLSCSHLVILGGVVLEVYCYSAHQSKHHYASGHRGVGMEKQRGKEGVRKETPLLYCFSGIDNYNNLFLEIHHVNVIQEIHLEVKVCLKLSTFIRLLCHNNWFFLIILLLNHQPHPGTTI